MVAIISIGSNIHPSENVRKSIELLSKYTRVRKISNVYRSPAVNRPDQPWFYNCAVMIETDLSAELLRSDVLARIETDLGRVRTSDKFAARTIDLDLMVCRSMAEGTPDRATVPADVLKHTHVALPLAELDPGLLLGECGIPLGEAVRGVSQDTIEKLSDYSATLLGELGIDKDAW